MQIKMINKNDMFGVGTQHMKPNKGVYSEKIMTESRSLLIFRCALH
jgi:hypothetical protein